MEERIKKLEQKQFEFDLTLSNHSETIAKLVTLYEGQIETNASVLRKLDKIAGFIDGQDTIFESHMLRCQERMDSRYVKQEQLRTIVRNAIDEYIQTNTDKQSRATTTMLNIVNTVYKLGVITVAVAAAVQVFLK